MKFPALAPALALAASVALSGPAFAQAMSGEEPGVTIRGVPVPGENVPDFQQKCHLLYLAQMDSLAGSSEESDPTMTGSIGSDNPDPASKDKQLELLASINVQDCRAAGLL